MRYLITWIASCSIPCVSDSRCRCVRSSTSSILIAAASASAGATAAAAAAAAASCAAAPAAFATTAARQRHSERAHASRGAVVSVASGRIARQRAAPSLA